MTHYNVSDTSKLDFKVGDVIRQLKGSKQTGKVITVGENYHGFWEMTVMFNDSTIACRCANSKEYFELESEAKKREDEWKDTWEESINSSRNY